MECPRYRYVFHRTACAVPLLMLRPPAICVLLRWEYNIRVPKWAILPAYTFARVSTSNLPTEPADP